MSVGNGFYQREMMNLNKNMRIRAKSQTPPRWLTCGVITMFTIVMLQSVAWVCFDVSLIPVSLVSRLEAHIQSSRLLRFGPLNLLSTVPQSQGEATPFLAAREATMADAAAVSSTGIPILNPTPSATVDEEIREIRGILYSASMILLFLFGFLFPVGGYILWWQYEAAAGEACLQVDNDEYALTEIPAVDLFTTSAFQHQKGVKFLHEMFERTAREFSDADCIICIAGSGNRRRISYAEIDWKAHLLKTEILNVLCPVAKDAKKKIRGPPIEESENWESNVPVIAMVGLRKNLKNEKDDIENSLITHLAILKAGYCCLDLDELDLSTSDGQQVFRARMQDCKPVMVVTNGDINDKPMLSNDNDNADIHRDFEILNVSDGISKGLVSFQSTVLPEDVNYSVSRKEEYVPTVLNEYIHKDFDPKSLVAAIFYGNEGIPVLVSHASLVNRILDRSDMINLLPGLDKVLVTNGCDTQPCDWNFGSLYTAFCPGIPLICATTAPMAAAGKNGKDFRMMVMNRESSSMRDFADTLRSILRSERVTFMDVNVDLLERLGAEADFPMLKLLCINPGTAYSRDVAQDILKSWMGGFERRIFNFLRHSSGPLLLMTNDCLRQAFPPPDAVSEIGKEMEDGKILLDLVGSPSMNTTCVILDKNSNPLGRNKIGELCISGAQVARGFLNMPELTMKRFMKHKKYGRLFCTGLQAKIDDGHRVWMYGVIEKEVPVLVKQPSAIRSRPSYAAFFLNDQHSLNASVSSIGTDSATSVPSSKLEAITTTGSNSHDTSVSEGGDLLTASIVGDDPCAPGGTAITQEETSHLTSSTNTIPQCKSNDDLTENGFENSVLCGPRESLESLRENYFKHQRKSEFLHELFESTAKAYPNNMCIKVPGVCFGDAQGGIALTYKEISCRSTSLSQFLLGEEVPIVTADRGVKISVFDIPSVVTPKMQTGDLCDSGSCDVSGSHVGSAGSPQHQPKATTTAIPDSQRLPIRGPNQIVAVFVERKSWHIYCCHLAVLKAGATLLMLDVNQPEAQLKNMLEDAQPAAVLCCATEHEEKMSKVIQEVNQEYTGSSHISVLNVAAILDDSRADLLYGTNDRKGSLKEECMYAGRPDGMCGEATWGTVSDSDFLVPDPQVKLRSPTWLTRYHPATLYFTSGSTGKPKGVLGKHESYMYYLLDHSRYHGFRMNYDRVLAGANLSFCVSLKTMYSAWICGIPLVVATDNVMRSGPDLAKLIQDEQITYASLVPSLLPTISTKPEADFPVNNHDENGYKVSTKRSLLRTLEVGGEALPWSLIEPWTRGGRRLVNGYGPTETTIVISRHMYLRDDKTELYWNYQDSGSIGPDGGSIGELKQWSGSRYSGTTVSKTLLPMSDHRTRNLTKETSCGQPSANVTYMVLQQVETVDDSSKSEQQPNFRLCQFGEVGELCVVGPFVALCYMHDQRLTDEKFLRPEQVIGIAGCPEKQLVVSPNTSFTSFDSTNLSVPVLNGDRIYRTGDLCSIDPLTKEVIGKGRADHQIKIRGIRLELGAIEQALEKAVKNEGDAENAGIGGVKMPEMNHFVSVLTKSANVFVVSFHKLQREGKQQTKDLLVAVIAVNGSTLSKEDSQLLFGEEQGLTAITDGTVVKSLQALVKQQITSAAVPSEYFVVLDTDIPRLARSYKLDRKTLKVAVEEKLYAGMERGADEMVGEDLGANSGEERDETTEVQQRVLSLCTRVLNKKISLHDNFLTSVGVDSLTVAELASELREANFFLQEGMSSTYGNIGVRELMTTCSSPEKIVNHALQMRRYSVDMSKCKTKEGEADNITFDDTNFLTKPLSPLLFTFLQVILIFGSMTIMLLIICFMVIPFLLQIFVYLKAYDVIDDARWFARVVASLTSYFFNNSSSDVDHQSLLLFGIARVVLLVAWFFYKVGIMIAALIGAVFWGLGFLLCAHAISNRLFKAVFGLEKRDIVVVANQNDNESDEEQQLLLDSSSEYGSFVSSFGDDIGVNSTKTPTSVKKTTAPAPATIASGKSPYFVPLWSPLHLRSWWLQFIQRFVIFIGRRFGSSAPKGMLLRKLGSERIGTGCRFPDELLLVGLAEDLEVGDNVMMNVQSSIFTTQIAKRKRISDGKEFPGFLVGKVVIGDNVTMYPACTIMPNTEIGDNALLEPQTTLNFGMNVGPNEIWAGVPGKKITNRRDHLLFPPKENPLVLNSEKQNSCEHPAERQSSGISLPERYSSTEDVEHQNWIQYRGGDSKFDVEEPKKQGSNGDLKFIDYVEMFLSVAIYVITLVGWMLTSLLGLSRASKLLKQTGRKKKNLNFLQEMYDVAADVTGLNQILLFSIGSDSVENEGHYLSEMKDPHLSHGFGDPISTARQDQVSKSIEGNSLLFPSEEEFQSKSGGYLFVHIAVTVFICSTILSFFLCVSVAISFLPMNGGFYRGIFPKIKPGIVHKDTYLSIFYGLKFSIAKRLFRKFSGSMLLPHMFMVGGATPDGKFSAWELGVMEDFVPDTALIGSNNFWSNGCISMQKVLKTVRDATTGKFTSVIEIRRIRLPQNFFLGNRAIVYPENHQSNLLLGVKTHAHSQRQMQSRLDKEAILFGIPAIQLGGVNAATAISHAPNADKAEEGKASYPNTNPEESMLASYSSYMMRLLLGDFFKNYCISFSCVFLAVSAGYLFLTLCAFRGVFNPIDLVVDHVEGEANDIRKIRSGLMIDGNRPSHSDRLPMLYWILFETLVIIALVYIIVYPIVFLAFRNLMMLILARQRGSGIFSNGSPVGSYSVKEMVPNLHLCLWRIGGLSFIAQVQWIFGETLMASWYWRVAGAEIGTNTLLFGRVFQCMDFSCISIGNNSVLHHSHFQLHSYENHMFKTLKTKIGDDCIIGGSTTLMGGTLIGDNVEILPGSCAMKGENWSTKGAKYQGAPLERVN